MIRTGIDIAEISRFSKMENLDAFIKRIFTNRENEYFLSKKNPYESIAGCYAAKEAFSKYMGTGMRGFAFRDIEVIHNEMGKPIIWFKGKPATVDLSISHSETTAVAVVCGEENAIGDYGELIKDYKKLLPKRWDSMNKRDCGRVFILAGSLGMTGAATLCARACLRSGSGLVTVGTASSQQPILADKLTEAMTVALDEQDGMVSLNAKEQILTFAEKSDVSVIGPGLGNPSGMWQIIKPILELEKPLLLDADGLNAISKHIDVLGGNHGDVVLTPHPGEMSRLSGLSIPEIEGARAEVASKFAKSWGVTLLLKGKDTVIASPRGDVHINQTGNSGMATGGMGDVLSGIIASFMGYGLDGYHASVLGAFLHGFSGDMAKNELGEFGMLAGDVVERLPYAIKLLQDK